MQRRPCALGLASELQGQAARLPDAHQGIVTTSLTQSLYQSVRVAVVCGGQSEEHGLSCVTAGSVLRALDPERYDVVPIGITQDGRWVLVEADAATLRIGDDGALPAITSAASPHSTTVA